MTQHKLQSERGKELAIAGLGFEQPFLTVELYIKWYDLYVVFPDGKVERLHDDVQRSRVYEEAERQFHGTAYADHCWHPVFVSRLADKLNMELDPLAQELLIGRWRLLHDHNE